MKLIEKMELNAAFTYLLNELNQEVESVSFNEGINHYSERYFKSEITVKKLISMCDIKS